jgi:endonuclease/exonuclease/phosphatase family metal-dependent hydrolase
MMERQDGSGARSTIHPTVRSVDRDSDRRLLLGAISVASFNIHGGVDGWGRPFDVLDACRALDADVIVLQENTKRPGAASIATTVGRALGYAVVEVPFTAVQVVASPTAGPAEQRWGPRFLWPAVRAIRYPDRGSPVWHRTTRGERDLDWESAELGLAVLSRIVAVDRSISLPKLISDPSRRSAISLEVGEGAGTLRVVGVHFGHLTHGSIVQMRALARAVRTGPPTVLVGDMNAWGPVVRTALPSFRRAIRQPTWPSWRPRHQIDHFLVSPDVSVAEANVLAPLGSDHLPIRAVIRPR